MPHNTCGEVWRGAWDHLAHRCDLPAGHGSMPHHGEEHRCRCLAGTSEKVDRPLKRSEPSWRLGDFILA